MPVLVLRKWALLVGIAGLASACNRSASPVFAAPAASAPSSDSAPAAPSDEAPRWPSHAGGPGIPEDPAAGRRSEEQWREHLGKEDHERELACDRHALKHHQAIVAMLVRARREYDRARTEKAVEAAKAHTTELQGQVEALLTKINVWGNVSPLTMVYRSMVQSLQQDFPDDRLAAIKGNAEGQKARRLDWDRRQREIRSYLREAAESEGDGE